MYFKVAKTINLLVAVLMLLEILGASVTVLPWSQGATIYSEELTSSALDSILFEKAEEESEETEEEKYLLRVVLIDFSQITLSLSAYHSPDLNLAVNTIRYDARPPVHLLNCVLLI